MTRGSLAALLVSAARRRAPPPDVPALARVFATSESTLARRWRSIGVTPKIVLDAVHCLHLVIGGRPWNPREDLLGFRTDERTIDSLLARAGLNTLSRPTIDEFVAHQKFFDDREFQRELLRALRDR